MTETEPGFGETFGFRQFRQVSVLFALGLNGFGLGFRKKRGEIFKKIQKKAQKKPKKAPKKPNKIMKTKVSFVVSVLPCFARIPSD